MPSRKYELQPNIGPGVARPVPAKPGDKDESLSVRPRMHLTPGERRDVTQIARKFTRTAFKCLVDILRNGNVAPAARVSAAKEILLRGWGPPSGLGQDLGELGDNELAGVVQEIVRRRTESGQMVAPSWDRPRGARGAFLPRSAAGSSPAEGRESGVAPSVTVDTDTDNSRSVGGRATPGNDSGGAPEPLPEHVSDGDDPVRASVVDAVPAEAAPADAHVVATPLPGLRPDSGDGATSTTPVAAVSVNKP